MQITSRISRRALLSGAAASLALPLLPRKARALSAPTVSESAWRELGCCITGGVLRPNDPRFVRLTQPENLHFYNPPADPDGPVDPDAPFGVVRPHSPAEVARAIKWCRDNNMPMVARSGGHSYAGCSTVAGLIINTSAMRDVAVQDGLIEAEGGVIFGDMLAKLRHIKVGVETGRYTITHGDCRDVGLSAYLMGGGWALDSSHLGMGCDRVKKVELVLANGDVVVASDDNHPDLFWAVRGGGGGNLALATKWWLEPIWVQNVVAFAGNWRLSGNAEDVFQTLMRALDRAPTAMGAELTVSTTHETVRSQWPYALRLHCVFHGSLDDFNSILGSALAAADRDAAKDCTVKERCSSQDLRALSYWEAQEFLQQVGSPNRYQETSLFVPEFTDDLIRGIFAEWKSWPKNVSAARLSAYRIGGKVNQVKADAMAFVHRRFKWMLSTDIDWSDAGDPHLDENLDWQRRVQDKFSAMLGDPGSYQNFADPGLNNHAAAYWGSNLPRLSQIKHQYDPEGVFSPPRNQGIP